MHTERLIFPQLMDFLPLPEFRRCVARYQGEYKGRGFSCLDHFLPLAFAQLSYRERSRGIETCLRAVQSKRYHLGIRGRVARSTLADANETRDWRIYGDFAQTLIDRARALYCAEPLAVELTQTAYTFDATTIDLCLALFPWARFRRTEAAVKLHTLLDRRGSIPTVVEITDGKAADVTLDALVFELGAFYILDQGYTDFGHLHAIMEALAFVVIRGKRGLAYTRRVSRPVDKTACVRRDQTIGLCGPKTATLYPVPLWSITYVDGETGRRSLFLTNNLTLPVLQFAHLYRCRWQVELFVKWLKQHLWTEAFYGTSLNAAKTQVRIAISVYVGGHPREASGAPAEPLHNSPSIQCDSVRKKHPFLKLSRNCPTRAPRGMGVTSCYCSIDNRTVALHGQPMQCRNSLRRVLVGSPTTIPKSWVCT